MKLPFQIQFKGTEASDALESVAIEHLRKLETFAPNLVACRVTISLDQKHKHQGRPFSVHIDLTLAGRELVVSKVLNEDPYVALRDAFDTMRRQLESLLRRRRGEQKVHAVPLHGTVVRIDEGGGFGFIRTPDRSEYYFSRDNLARGPFEHLQEGTRVQFLPEMGDLGLQAKRVSVGKHAMG